MFFSGSSIHRTWEIYMNQKPVPIAITIAEASPLARVGRTIFCIKTSAAAGFRPANSATAPLSCAPIWKNGSTICLRCAPPILGLPMPHNCEALAYPRAVEPYFDLIQVWRREPLDEATCAWLSGQCRHLHLENRAARFDSRLRQRVEMKGLSEAGLTWLVAQEDAFLNRLEIAMDLHFDDEDALDSTFQFFHCHLVRRHLRVTQEVRCYRRDGQTLCRE
jgi:hypothetical protein